MRAQEMEAPWRQFRSQYESEQRQEKLEGMWGSEDGLFCLGIEGSRERLYLGSSDPVEKKI